MTNRTSVMTAQPASDKGAYRGAPQIWEAAVGRGEDCLKANARRYRVKGRNPARAALNTLRHEKLTMAEALHGNVNIAIYPAESPAGNPVAVFGLAGNPKSPQLVVRLARLQPPEMPLHRKGGPLDKAALRDEMPAAARQRAEEQLGSGGLRELVRSRYWERELTLYCGTAAVLAAIGFPMTPGVFVVGAVILFFRGLVRLAAQEARIRLLKRRIAQDPNLQSVLNTTAIRHVFAQALDIASDKLQERLARTVMRGALTVPDLNGDHAVMMYVDEDSRVAAGGLKPAQLDGAVPAEDRDILPEDLSSSDNVLTVVFRRPKRRANVIEKPNSAAAQTQEDGDFTPRPGPPKVDLDDLGAQSKVPAKVDIDDLGGANRERGRAGGDDEIVDAEVIDEEQMYRGGR
jgi:hypothetical protein